mgnify:CR=1 FL=1
MLTHRQRIMAALNHQTPDRVPVDIAGTGASQVNIEAYRALKGYLGLDASQPIEFFSKRSHLAMAEEEVLQKLDVDCRVLCPPSPDHSIERELPDGSYIDAWGVVWTKPERGHYYVKQPIFTGDLTAEALARYAWPNPHDPGFTRGLSEAARSLHENTDYAVVLSLPVGFGHQSQFLRGYESWLMDLVDNLSGAEALADAVLDVYIPLVRNMVRACAPYIDVVFYADDVAFQNGPIMRPEMFRRLFKPRLKRIFDAIRAESQAKILFHSCGSVVSLIPDLLDTGIDCLNPVQVSAAGMDTAKLKREYGRDLSFWGAIDTHRVLPFGSPQDVRDEVHRRINDLAEGGGYVVASVHNIQAEVPPENIVAMVEAARSA